MSKGVVILALGHVNYGNYAMQLARSIKAVDECNITLLYNHTAIGHIKDLFTVFDTAIEVPREYYITNGLPDYVKAKTYLYELSPYEETIYIDADVIWLPQRKISDLFNNLSDIDIIIGNRGKESLKEAKKGFIHWADPSDIIHVYGSEGNIYNLSSEFMYFKKCDKVEVFFNLAIIAYLNPKIKFKKFAHHLPDELAFIIAMIQTQIEFFSPYIPFYWEQFEVKSTRKTKPIFEIYKEYYGYSMGGNTNTKNQEQIYNNIANISNKKFKVNGYFPAKSKKNWLVERKDL